MNNYIFTCLVTGKTYLICAFDVSKAAIYARKKLNLMFYTIDKSTFEPKHMELS